MAHFKKMGLPLAIGALLASGSALAASTISYDTKNSHSTYNGPNGTGVGPVGWSGTGPNYSGGGLPADWYVNFDVSGGTAALNSTDSKAAGAMELMVGPRAMRDTTNY